MTTQSIYPAWDGTEPIEVYKWRRDREMKLARAQSSTMATATRADGTKLYTITSGGNFSRTEPLSPKRRREVIERDKRCVECHAGGPFEVHHIVRYIDGGSNEMDNLVTLCETCHRSKGGR